jgi:hypothetical protein
MRYFATPLPTPIDTTVLAGPVSTPLTWMWSRRVYKARLFSVYSSTLLRWICNYFPRSWKDNSATLLNKRFPCLEKTLARDRLHSRACVCSSLASSLTQRACSMRQSHLKRILNSSILASRQLQSGKNTTATVLRLLHLPRKIEP